MTFRKLTRTFFRTTRKFSNIPAARPDTAAQHQRLLNFLRQPRQLTIPGPQLSLGEVGLSADELEKYRDQEFSARAIHTIMDAYEQKGEAHYSLPPEQSGMFLTATKKEDPAYLFYRGLASWYERAAQYGRSHEETTREILRGYFCSAQSKTGGAHRVIADPTLHLLTPTPAIGANFPHALGTALSIYLGQQYVAQPHYPSDAISIISAGNGSVDHPSALSCFNLARNYCEKHNAVPLMMVITDNHSAISQRNPTSVKNKLEPWGFRIFYGDSKNPLYVYQQARKCQDYVRNTRKPAFLVLETYRLFGHSVANPRNENFSAAELETLYAQDPLFYLIQQGVTEKVWSYQDSAAAYQEIFTNIATLAEEVAAEPKVGKIKPERRPTAQTITLNFKHRHMRQAITQALRETLEQHQEAIFYGQDITPGHYGVGMNLEKIAPGRVFPFAIDELGEIGIAIGLMNNGLLPIAEISYKDYLLHGGLQQLVSGTLQRFLVNSARPPRGMICRMPFGGLVKGGPTHNENSLPERAYPNLKVFVVSTPLTARLSYQLALSHALQGDICVINEATACYYLQQADLPGDCQALFANTTSLSFAYGDHLLYQYSSGQLSVLPQSAITAATINEKTVIVTYGNGVKLALEAAFADENVCVLDLPCVSVTPALLATLQQAKAVVIVDECRPASGPGEAIAAQLAQARFTGAIELVQSPASFIPSGPGNKVNYINQTQLQEALERSAQLRTQPKL